MTRLFATAALAATLSTAAAAQTWSSNAPKIGPVNQPEGILIEAYPASTNHCQTGYQPVVVGGVICCGIPNATMSTQSNPAPASSCPAGTKGCS